MIWLNNALQSHIITPCVIITCLPSKVGLRNTLPNSVKSATSIAKLRHGLQKKNLVDKTKSKSYNHGQRNLDIN